MGKQAGQQEKRSISSNCVVCGDEMLLDYEVDVKFPKWKVPDGLRTICGSCENYLAQPLAAWALKVAKKAAYDARKAHEDENNHYTIH